MSSHPYTNKQIEVANLLRSTGRDGISSDTTDEIVESMIEDGGVEEAPPPGVDVITLIRMRIMDEPDWRKRASLAAALISKSFDY